MNAPRTSAAAPSCADFHVLDAGSTSRSRSRGEPGVGSLGENRIARFSPDIPGPAMPCKSPSSAVAAVWTAGRIWLSSQSFAAEPQIVGCSSEATSRGPTGPTISVSSSRWARMAIASTIATRACVNGWPPNWPSSYSMTFADSASSPIAAITSWASFVLVRTSSMSVSTCAASEPSLACPRLPHRRSYSSPQRSMSSSTPTRRPCARASFTMATLQPQCDSRLHWCASWALW